MQYIESDVILFLYILHDIRSLLKFVNIEQILYRILHSSKAYISHIYSGPQPADFTDL